MALTSGLLLVDKPSGLTSHDVVAIVRRGARERRVGHAGTLDPLATGLLVVCLGAATRLSEYLLDKDKHYQARVRLGAATDTYDAAGEVLSVSEQLPERAAVEAALAAFRGPIMQTPPAFSALKLGGQRAYALARRGEAVALAPRPVTIYALELTEWTPPECVLDIHCSAGTYIRSLAHDLGRALGCGAHLAALRRTASGGLQLADAAPLDELRAGFASGDWRRHLRPLDAAVPEWPALHLSADEARRVQNGQAVRLTAQASGWARAYNPAGKFFAVLRADPGAGVWRPEKVLGEN